MNGNSNTSRQEAPYIDNIEPVGVSEQAAKLFKSILEQEDLEKYKTISSEELLPLCREVGLLFHRKVQKKPNQIIRCLSNYHNIILSYSTNVTDSILNNISLHFILLSSYTLIARGDTQMAKEILKKCVPYVDSTNPNPQLLGIAVCNLCTLRMQRNKFYKSIPLLLKTINKLEVHLSCLKRAKKKTQFIEDTVIEIHAYLLLSKCLKNVMRTNKNQFYKDLYLHAHQIGMRKCVKYLGKQSMFTKQFYDLDSGFELELPVFREPVDDSILPQQKIMRQLQNIEGLLQKHLQNPPQTIIVKQERPATPPPPPPPLPPVEEPSEQKFQIDPKKVVGHSKFYFGDWRIDAQIAKQEEQKIGTVLLQCYKGKDHVNLMVLEQRFMKLLSQMNIEDILPYQCCLDNLTANQVIKYCIMEFLFLDENKNIEIFPRATGLLRPMVTTIIDKRCLIFTYHIRYNCFRLAICPLSSSETFYLDIDIHSDCLAKFFQMDEETQQRMENIYCLLMQANNSQKKMKVNQIKRIHLLNEEGFETVIKDILGLFVIFLQEHINDMGQGDIFNKKKEYFKFAHGAGSQTKGTFYYIRYLPHIKGFDIYAANTHATFNPDGKSKAKGNILYNSVQFYRDFGSSSGNIQQEQHFRCFSQLIAKKYYLKMYEQPLNTKDKEVYQQNSIVQKKITQKTFLRKMREHQNQVLPITACIINLNNQFPIGLRLTGYNPTTYTEASFFIHIFPEVWRWPDKMEETPEDFIAGAVQEYGYKKNFFLVEWLHRFGFRQIINMLKVTSEGNFELKDYFASFLRIAKVIDQIYV